MLVDRIEPLDKRRCKVFLDGDFAFVLYRGEIKRYQITVGEELSEALYEEILTDVISKRTRERALHLLKFSSRTETELRRKLLSALYPARAVEAAIEFLKEYRYLDDRSYAENYIEVYGKRKSRQEILCALQRKGVDKACIKELLEEAEPDEDGQLRTLLEKRRYFEEADSGGRRKTIAFLMRKGYSYESIRRVAGEMEEPEGRQW